MVKFYGYKKCSTCRKAEKFLEQANIAYKFIDITENPPDVDELAAIAKLSAIPLKKFFNTSGVQYRELKIKAQLPQLTELEVLALLAGNGRLIKRPLITDGQKVSVGFNQELFVETWTGN